MRTFTISIAILLYTIAVSAQTGFQEYATPKKYAGSFSVDQQRYYAATRFVDSLAGTAFNIWKAAQKAKWKNYNIDSLLSLYEHLGKEAFLKKLDFFRSNPDSYASLHNFRLWILNSSLISYDSLASVYKTLSADLRQTPLGIHVADAILQKKSLQMGKVAPDFTFIAVDGGQGSLSSFRGRPVLLCFWASWCGPCLRSLPKLIMINSAYEEKGLQIISVSIDKDMTKWKGAIKRNEMSWLQTCDNPKYILSSSLVARYDVTSIPRYILLDRQGHIVYQNILSKDNDDFEVLQLALREEFQ